VLAGFFIVLAMTGMDQETMQKNISVKTLRDSQKNMLLLTAVLTAVLVLFMYLGGLLYLYAPRQVYRPRATNLPACGDGAHAGCTATDFLHRPDLGAVPSADGAMTALTSSFSIDILGVQRRTD
jgi:uncharacterized sodium:solute symporter family permease YidK